MLKFKWLLRADGPKCARFYSAKVGRILKNSKVASSMHINELKSIDQSQQPIIECRDKKYLAGSTSKNFPKTLPIYLHNEFKAIELSNQHNNILDIGANLRPILDDIFNHENKSAVLIKNLPITKTDHFHDFMKGCDYQPMTYESGSAYRASVNDLVYSASDEPPEFSIEPHNEMSYLSQFPQKIIFCCLSKASFGGESPIVFNRDLIKQLDSNIFDKFRTKGIRYSRNLKHQNNTNYITWQNTFFTDNKKEAENKMENQGFEWKWKSNGDVTIWYQLPAFFTQPHSGEEIWFNQATANHCTYYKSHPMFEGKEDLPPSEYPYHCCYGDGEEIEDDVIDHIRSVMWRNAMSLALFPGDVLILDNLLCQHSRIGYEGGERKVVVFLGEPINR
ncbi:dapdiamide synthesis protein DdaC-like [Clytia hemisphaerica]